MRAGGRPSWTVCGPSHRASPTTTPFAEGLAVPGSSYHAGAGAAEPAERSAPRPSSRQEQNVETSRDPSESFPSHRSARLVRSDSDLRVGCEGSSETCRSSHYARGGLIGASRGLRWLPIGGASEAVNRTSPFTHSAKFKSRFLHEARPGPHSGRFSGVPRRRPSTRCDDVKEWDTDARFCTMAPLSRAARPFEAGGAAFGGSEQLNTRTKARTVTRKERFDLLCRATTVACPPVVGRANRSSCFLSGA